MQQKDDTKIRLSGLKPGIYNYEIDLDERFFEGFENGEIEGGRVHFDVRMERTERLTMLNIRMEGTLSTWCDRCLGSMEVPVQGEETLQIRQSDTEQSDDEQVAILPEDATEIDLAPWLYEYAAVRLPMRHMHPDGECDPEMTKYIGTDVADKPAEYTDPRWDALKELK